MKKWCILFAFPTLNYGMWSGWKTPGLSSLLPASATAGSAGFTMTVTGRNFGNKCVLLWNGSSRPTRLSDLVVCDLVDVDGNQSTLSSGSGLAFDSQSSLWGTGLESGVKATAGAITPTFISNKSATFAAGTVAFKPK